MNSVCYSTVEAVLSWLDAIDISSGATFELWITQSVTFRGKPTQLDVALALIVDRALGKGYEPAGFKERLGGRIYRFKLLADTDPYVNTH